MPRFPSTAKTNWSFRLALAIATSCPQQSEHIPAKWELELARAQNKELSYTFGQSRLLFLSQACPIQICSLKEVCTHEQARLFAVRSVHSLPCPRHHARPGVSATQGPDDYSRVRQAL